MHYLLKANTDLDMKLKMSASSGCLRVTDFASEKAKSDVHLLLLPPVTNFVRGKAKTDQVYEMNKPHMHHLLMGC